MNAHQPPAHVIRALSAFLAAGVLLDFSALAFFRQPPEPSRGQPGRVPAPRTSTENPPKDPVPAIAS